MGTLLIDRKDAELRREGTRLLVYEQGTRTGSIPVSHLDRVIIQNHTVINTGLLGVLAEHGVGLVVINQRRPKATAILLGSFHNDAARRLAQYQYGHDEAWRQAWSSAVVIRKLHGQKQFLVHALKYRPDQRYSLSRAIKNINKRLCNLQNDPTLDRERIRGIEGAAAAAYFRGFTQIFPPAFEFTCRNRRPPKDPVNACLSLSYTLLHSDTVLALYAAGLDPMLGFYHDIAYGRESLACDFVEPLRPRIDNWVWRLFAERELRLEHFSTDKGACLLNKAGRKIFYASWETYAPLLRRTLRRSAHILVRKLFSDTGTGIETGQEAT